MARRTYDTSWHPAKTPNFDTRQQRLEYLIEQAALHAPRAPATIRLKEALDDSSVSEKQVARDAYAAIVQQPGPVPNALAALMTQVSRGSRSLQQAGRTGRDVMKDEDTPNMHRHVINLNAALANFPKAPADDHATALAFLNILVPLEGLLTDQLMNKNLKPLQAALAEIKDEAIWEDVMTVVQLKTVHESGIGINTLVNAWRHGNFHWAGNAYHHADAPDHPFSVDDLARYATHGLATWQASQIAFALLLSANEP